MKDIGRRLGDEIGQGAEKVIFEDRDRNEVVGIYRDWKHEESRETALARLYLTKLLHALLPRHIPDAHLASAKHRAIAVDRVELDPIHQRWATLWGEVDAAMRADEDKESVSAKQKQYGQAYGDLRRQMMNNTPQYEDFMGSLAHVAGPDMARHLDSSTGNFSFDPDGTIRYVDTLNPWYSNSEEPEYDAGQLRRSIDERLVGAQRTKAEGWLARLEDLWRQEQKRRQIDKQQSAGV